MNPKIFKAAAELVKKQYFACHAIHHALCNEGEGEQTLLSEEEDFFHSLYRPPGQGRMEAYLSADEDDYSFPEKLRRELALLFAYEMAKDLSKK